MKTSLMALCSAGVILANATCAFATTVVLKGMTFIDKPIVLTPEDSGKVFVGEEGAVVSVGARNCLFENCRVAHTANHAFRLHDGCVSNRIVNCTMEDIGAGGVPSSLNFVNNIVLSDGCRLASPKAG